MIKGVREMGMETCMTLGMMTPDQADASRKPVLIITIIMLIRQKNFTVRYHHAQFRGSYRNHPPRRMRALMYAREVFLGMGEQIGDHANASDAGQSEPAATIGADQHADTDCGHTAG